ncbi:MAG: hypothetical protein KDA99_01395, partial [Planctomycetales bacterium]|nr:hypothetical protein [Planctomycetales bacterium]
MRWTICCFTAAAVLLMIATADVAGQVRAVRVLPSGAIITSEISVDVGNADVAAQIAAAAEATEGDASESSSTDDKLLQMFQQLKFDRRPSAILRQWSKPEPELEPEPKLEPNDDPAADKDDAADDNTEAKDEGAAEKESTEEATTVEQSTKEKAGEEAATDEAATDEAATDEAATQEKAEEQAKVEAEKAKRKQEAEQKHEAWVKKKLELFQRHVTLGQWEKVREFFAGLPEKQREPAYKHLLTQLAVGPQPQQNAGNVPQLSPEMFADQDPMAVAMAMQTIMQVQGGGDPLMLEQNVFSTHDVLEIALACPSKKGLQKSESQQLGRILTTSLRTGSVLDGLLNELDEAVADGAKSKILSKRQAAWILFSAGRTLEAGDFLPKMDEAKEAHDREGLNLLSRYYLAKYREESKPADLEQAWFVTQAVLAMEDESVTGSDGNKGDNEANADEVAADEKSETDDTGDGAAVAEVVTDPFAQGVAVEGDAGVQDDEVVKKSDGVSAEKEEALKRAVELAPKVRKELGQAWLRETFTTGEKRGQELLAAIGTATATGMQRYPHNPTERLRGLQLQSTAVEALMQHAPERARQWRDALNVLANNWLKEAAFTYLRDESTQRGPRLQRDMYGNIFYYEDSYNRSMRGNGQAQPVSTDDVLKVRPDDQWLAMLDDMMRPKYSMTVAQLLLKVNEETEAFPYIEQLAAAHKEKADQLANEFLDVWSRNHNPNEANQRTSSYMFMYGYESRAAQIPLTRSKQVRNLQELSQWIARMRAIPIENIDQKKLVKAFTACHSTAEVYRLEDIEQVFGSVDKLEPETLATMIDSMRASLATVWREPDEQKKAGTNRKKQDLQAEIERGYQVAAEVLQRAIMEYPESWQLWCTQASLKFDENDYRYELANDSQFVARRDEAFADFAKAAELYAAQVSDLADDKQDTEIYDKWWYASLGAVDLGRIDTSKQPDLRQPPKIREAMMALPGESAE